MSRAAQARCYCSKISLPKTGLLTPKTLLFDVLSAFANTQVTALYLTAAAQAGACAVLCKSEAEIFPRRKRPRNTK